MAKVTEVKTYDDYTGDVIEHDTVVGTDLTLDGMQYQLDLSGKSREKLEEVLQPFIKNVTPLRVSRRGRISVTGQRQPAKVDKEQNRQMREWWMKAHEAGVKHPNGNHLPQPSDRGRIPQAVEDAYHENGGVVPHVEVAVSVTGPTTSPDGEASKKTSRSKKSE